CCGGDTGFDHCTTPACCPEDAVQIGMAVLVQELGRWQGYILLLQLFQIAFVHIPFQYINGIEYRKTQLFESMQPGPECCRMQVIIPGAADDYCPEPCPVY